MTDKEKRIAALEKALAEACSFVESAADVIDELEPGDIDGESENARRHVAAWRELLANG